MYLGIIGTTTRNNKVVVAHDKIYLLLYSVPAIVVTTYKIVYNIQCV